MRLVVVPLVILALALAPALRAEPGTPHAGRVLRRALLGARRNG